MIDILYAQLLERSLVPTQLDIRHKRRSSVVRIQPPETAYSAALQEPGHVAHLPIVFVRITRHVEITERPREPDVLSGEGARAAAERQCHQPAEHRDRPGEERCGASVMDACSKRKGHVARWPMPLLENRIVLVIFAAGRRANTYPKYARRTPRSADQPGSEHMVGDEREDVGDAIVAAICWRRSKTNTFFPYHCAIVHDDIK